MHSARDDSETPENELFSKMCKLFIAMKVGGCQATKKTKM